MGDASEARQQYAFQCKMGLTIKWHPKGESVEKAYGESINVGQYEGVLVDREQHYELWWFIPEKSDQYEIVLASGKKMPSDELIKIAQSFQ